MIIFAADQLSGIFMKRFPSGRPAAIPLMKGLIGAAGV
jgi:hypothetical protein